MREKEIFIISEYLFRYFTNSRELIRRDTIEYSLHVNENADLNRRTLRC